MVVEGSDTSSQSVSLLLFGLLWLHSGNSITERDKKEKQQQRQQTPDDNFDALARFDLTYLLLLTKKRRKELAIITLKYKLNWLY